MADGVQRRTIGEMVKEQRPCEIVGFDPETFEVGYHEVTGFYEGPEDKIFEVRLASGRRVRVTAGHNLFTIGRGRASCGRCAPPSWPEGVMVAVARRHPRSSRRRAPAIDLRDVIPEARVAGLAGRRAPPSSEPSPTSGPRSPRGSSEAAALTRATTDATGQLPWAIAECVPGVHDQLGRGRLRAREGRAPPPPARRSTSTSTSRGCSACTSPRAHRRDGQITIANTDQRRLDRLEATFTRLGLPVHRSEGAITVLLEAGEPTSSTGSAWAATLRPSESRRRVRLADASSIEAFLEGLVDGDGSVAGGRTSVWTTSEGLVSDVLAALRPPRASGPDRRCKAHAEPPAVAGLRARTTSTSSSPAVPLPDVLLRRAPGRSRASPRSSASRRAGYSARHRPEQHRERARAATPSGSRRSADWPSAYADAGRGHRRGSIGWSTAGWRGTASSRSSTPVSGSGSTTSRCGPAGRKIQNFLAGSRRRLRLQHGRLHRRRVGTGTSPWSCRTWPTCRSRSTRA